MYCHKYGFCNFVYLQKAVQVEVDALLKLKAHYKELTGEDLSGGGKRDKKSAKENKKPQQPKSEKATPQQAKPAAAAAASGDSSREVKKQTRLGMEMSKEENLADWYSQVITKADMIEYYDVSGCYVLRPWAFSIWEQIQKWFDNAIKGIGFENCYFPIFVSAAALEKEKEHIEDFAPEVRFYQKFLLQTK